jgi:hypothetical protein
MPYVRLRAISGEVVRVEHVEEPSPSKTLAQAHEYFASQKRCGEWGISLEAEPDPGEALTVTTGEALKDFVITVNLKPRTASEYPRRRGEGWEKAIGVLYYLAARPPNFDFSGSPAALIFEFYLGEADMARLLDLACAGRFPRGVTTEAEGMEYDAAPYGRGKKWDTTRTPQIPLNSISFNIPIGSRPEGGEETKESATFVGTDRILELSNRILELSKLAKWQERMFYALIALGVMLLIALTRR